MLYVSRRYIPYTRVTQDQEPRAREGSRRFRNNPATQAEQPEISTGGMDMGLHQVVELFMRVRRIILPYERTMDLQILRFPEGSWGVP